MRCSILRTFGPTAAIVSALWMPAASAQEFATILRDENALALTPTVRSWGMGGTYVGIDEVWSMNPAGLSRADRPQVEMTYGHWNPEQGPNSNAGRLDITAPIGLLGLDIQGGLRLMAYYYASNGSEDANPPFGDLEFESTTLGLQAGLDVTDWWALGVGAYPYEKGEVELVFPDVAPGMPGTGPSRIEVENMSKPGSIQAGTLFRLPYRVNVGAQYLYIKDTQEASYKDRENLSAFEPLEKEDDYYITYGTVGVSWEPVDWLLLGVDYWNGEAEGSSFIRGEMFDQDVDRWNFGAEVRLNGDLAVRAGSANGGTSLGFSWSAFEHVDVHYAFVYEAFEDKEAVWGRTNLHTIGMTLRF